MIKIKNILKSIRCAFRGEKLVFVFNYHRIGDVDPGNPFHLLHTVKRSVFKRQIRIMKTLGRFVSLNDIREFHKLGAVNFALTFDDVSQTVLDIAPFLQKQNIPFAIAPCVSITDRGFGMRDKVYFITKNLNQDDILSFVKEKVGDKYSINEADFSFYQFTKNNEVDPLFIEKEIIEPLAKRIPGLQNLLAENRAYLSWAEIKNLQSKGVTIINHSMNHYKKINLSRDAVIDDIKQSTEAFKQKLGSQPDYYAVPFGAVTQSLAIDVTDSLRECGYQAALWVTGSANLFRRSLPSQILQLSRIHTPTSTLGFIKRLILSLESAQYSIKDFFLQAGDRPEEFEILNASDPLPALSVENLIRQGRDYPSDQKFYRYCFTDNPYKNGHPDYYAIACGGRMESIGYNMHYPFVLNKQFINGIYWSSWRKLPYANKRGSAMTLLSAMKDTPILGSYKPSSIAQKGFLGKNWKKIVCTHLAINAHKVTPATDADIKQFDSFPDELSELTKSANQAYFFSIARSPQFYQWRYDKYPLAKAQYLVLHQNNKPAAYFVTLSNEQTLFISDFYCPNVADLKALVAYTLSQAITNEKAFVEIETSLPEVVDVISKSWPCQSSTFLSYYHLNPEDKTVGQVLADWESQTFHETQACGDVLVRPGEPTN